MTKLYKSITELVGDTPLLELGNFKRNNNLYGNIYAKLEYFNPAGSIKDRIAIRMLEEAEKEGKIKPGDTIVDNTSGNTGIALAAFAAAKGYKLIIFLEDGVTKERETTLKAYGVETHYFSDLPGFYEAFAGGEPSLTAGLRIVEKYAQEIGGFYIDQMENQENPKAHYLTTGPEIWDALDGKVDVFVTSVGTGGTLNGVGTYLKQKNPDIKIIAIHPAPESILSAENPDANIIDGTAAFAFVGEAGRTNIINEAYYDEIIYVKAEDAYEVARELAKSEGIFIGTSSGAVLLGAKQVAAKEEYKDKNIVGIVADDGFKYLSSNLYK